jgi:Tol biopolymer transport system component
MTAGTLGQMPINGGAPRELRENVAYADWTPDGKQFVIATADTPHRLEFPPGHVLYTSKGTGWLGEVRVSPKGDRIAFVDHMYFGTDAVISVIDSKGTKTDLTEKFGTLSGLAWTPDGKEIWFTAAKDAAQRALYAVSLDRKQRLIYKSPGAVTIHDINRDGKVLLTRDESSMAVEIQRAGDDLSRDLSWMDWSTIDDLSADGNTIALDESGDATEGVEGEGLVYIRKTDGSPAVRMAAKSAGRALSPDGKFLLAAVDEQNDAESALELLPIGPGAPIRIETGLQSLSTRTAWFPDSKRIVYSARVKGGKLRTWVQALDGKPQPITAEGERFVALSPDSGSVLAVGPSGYVLYPSGGGAHRPAPGLQSGDAVLGFVTGGKAVYVAPKDEMTRIFRLDLASGQREFWKLIRTFEPAGVRNIQNVRVTPDGKTVALEVYRTISNLYLATGMK